jgi:hypothetical protein
MKYFNKLKKQPVYLLFMGLTIFITFLSGCTKDFKSYNTDPTGITGPDLVPDGNIGAFFPNIEAGIFFTNGVGRAQYQVAQNLNADCYSGYMMSNNPFNPDVNNLNYFFTDRWNTNIFNYAYGTVMGGLNNLSKLGLSTSQPDFWAIALILKVEDMHRVTDKYGPIPYSQVGKTVVSSPYDDQKSVYNRFFAELDTAVSSLKAFVNANPGKKPFQKFDLIYGGNYNQWIKFANSLRLRLAMHIVKADAATAKLQGEKALADQGGLLSTNADLAQVAGIGSYQNPLYGIAVNYSDIRMGASAESILNGYQDPRLAKYFVPSTDPAFAGQYKGIRIGAAVPAKPGYNNFSGLNTTTSFTATAPMIMMTPSEIWFLKAEAALRGWANAGDAQTDYETGINTSFGQWGVSSATYINNAVSVPTSYVNPKNTVDNASAVSTITIKWDGSASNEAKLERIITQKWIAIFPEGQEAWTEFRRTGYPKLFPVVNNNSNGTISTEIQVRRLAYPASEYNGTNLVEIQKGLQFLAGPDNGGTRVWWDVNGPNF